MFLKGTAMVSGDNSAQGNQYMVKIVEFLFTQGEAYFFFYFLSFFRGVSKWGGFGRVGREAKKLLYSRRALVVFFLFLKKRVSIFFFLEGGARGIFLFFKK